MYVNVVLFLTHKALTRCDKRHPLGMKQIQARKHILHEKLCSGPEVLHWHVWRDLFHASWRVSQTSLAAGQGEALHQTPDGEEVQWRHVWREKDKSTKCLKLVYKHDALKSDTVKVALDNYLYIDLIQRSGGLKFLRFLKAPTKVDTQASKSHNDRVRCYSVTGFTDVTPKCNL